LVLDFSEDGLVIVALDVGTSSARACLYDADGRPVEGRFHQEGYEAATTMDGGSEHDASHLLHAVVACLDRVLATPPRSEILGVGVTSFWHGLLGFDAAGQPVTPVFTWADTRAAEAARQLREALGDDAIHARTGCHIHACYWPAKLRWLGQDRSADFRRVARWGSIGEHLELSFFGEAATSMSMASATGLFDQNRLAWDASVLAAAGIDEGQLFAVCDRDEGRRGLRLPWAGRWPALATATWFPAVGDGAASNIGSDCADPTRVALNVGTSAALRVVTDTLLTPPRGLWSYRIDRRRPIVGGATSEGGNVYAWLRSILHLPDHDELEGALARQEPDAHGLTMLPFLAGERSPGWRSERRAAVAGLSLATSAIDIVRAGLEAVALRLATVYDLLTPLASADHAIIASGGALTRSPAWAQIMADVLGRPLVLSREEEATSRGGALLALESLGRPAAPTGATGAGGETIVPDLARHARYREARTRQHRLDERV
jgi:gluconokinase